jgi:hypothetical protein
MRTGHLLFAVQFVLVYSIMEYVPVPFNAYIRVNPSFPKDLVPEMTAFFD